MEDIMASTTDIAELRLKVNEPDNAEPYTNEQLGALLDAKGTVSAAAADLWQRKASMYAELVNTSENGSSRQNGDLYKQALAMSALYRAEDQPVTPVDAAQRPRSRKIVRG
jgi:hypothetical protein